MNDVAAGCHVMRPKSDDEHPSDLTELLEGGVNDEMVVLSASDCQAVLALADAAWQVIDDMGVDRKSCCAAAKAMLRSAFEPFRDRSHNFDDWMSFDVAEKTLRECGLK